MKACSSWRRICEAETAGAALLKPYNDAPETSGYLTQKEAELQPIFEEALRKGVQIETHAIGDRANRVILDLYEKALKAIPPEQRKKLGLKK